jgi:DNA (cytosine-5)-methyltransferase 1
LRSRIREEAEIVRPIGIDLFAGAGGLSLGFESAGFDIAAAVEIDPIHCATHEFNFPYCKTICRSVLDICGADIRRMAGIGTKDIAVVFGGAPCQGFSMIGKRALDDPRNELVHHFVRLVLELRPRYFAFENVKGLTVGSQRQILIEMVESFGQAGYSVLLPYRVLSAADYGVPQERHRLFLLGARESCELPSYPAPRKMRVTVAEAIEDLPEADDFPELMERDWIEAEFGTPSAYARRLCGLANRAEDFGYRRVFDRGILTSSLRTDHTALSRRRFAETAFGKTEPVSRFYKLDPEGQCNTIRSGTASDRGAFTSPRPIHPYSPRCITNREAARLHSYPDWFRFHVTKWHGFRQIGNSVPPLLAKAVAAQIMAALGATPSVPSKALELGDPALLEFTMAQAATRYGVPDDVIPKRLRAAAVLQREREERATA